MFVDMWKEGRCQNGLQKKRRNFNITQQIYFCRCLGETAEQHIKKKKLALM